MNRRQALIALAAGIPFAAQNTRAEQTTLPNTGLVNWSAVADSKPLMSLSFTNRTITVYGSKRSVTVSLDEIVEALDPEKP